MQEGQVTGSCAAKSVSHPIGGLIYPTARIGELFRILETDQVGVVVDNGKIVGIVSKIDVLDYHERAEVVEAPAGAQDRPNPGAMGSSALHPASGRGGKASRSGSCYGRAAWPCRFTIVTLEAPVGRLLLVQVMTSSGTVGTSAVAATYKVLSHLPTVPVAPAKLLFMSTDHASQLSLGV
jgi:hypothetical protein